MSRESAFPLPPTWDGYDDTVMAQSGLSKRELFAAMAMQGLCANSIPGGHRAFANIARDAVRYADDTLAALKESET